MISLPGLAAHALRAHRWNQWRKRYDVTKQNIYLSFGMGEGAVGVGAGLILLEHYVILPSTLPPSLGRRAFTAIVAMVMPRAPPQL